MLRPNPLLASGNPDAPAADHDADRPDAPARCHLAGLRSPVILDAAAHISGRRVIVAQRPRIAVRLAERHAVGQVGDHAERAEDRELTGCAADQRAVNVADCAVVVVDGIGVYPCAPGLTAGDVAYRAIVVVDGPGGISHAPGLIADDVHRPRRVGNFQRPVGCPAVRRFRRDRAPRRQFRCARDLEIATGRGFD